ncbi:5'-nucleotidase C-terminal domain-containing protein [Methylotuvimicrobium sp. KM1]|uniref:5'-nucleotidase C-terminal domain-containing protein n=1 Tax=Methylotuvimicrobium sp. KM1 TaxID=3377707 RepID=UPI00384DA2E2
MFRIKPQSQLLLVLVGLLSAHGAWANNNSQPKLTLNNASAYENQGVISFSIQLNRPTSKSIKINAVPLPGTAKPARDFRPGAQRVTIPAGAKSATINIPIFDNDVAEPDKSFKLRIASAPGAKVVKGIAKGTLLDNDGPLTINILHINDHHSHLQPDAGRLNLGTSGGAFDISFGGFPRVTAKIKALENQLDNIVKVHAGDAITGTLYYTLFKGQADADLINTACFDIFALGNHEFDDGDAALAQFLDWLNSDPNCDTATVAANVVPALGTPLAANARNDYIEPYVIKEFDGQQVGFIGIDIAQKTQVSSQPFESTVFLDEVETAQYYVDELKAKGIENIVLVTHYGYQNDINLANQISGVDAIIGGDSHALLGDLSAFGLASSGPYPTSTLNKDGEPVCIAQAWQYSWVVGELNVTFEDGKLASCGGVPYLLLGDTFTRGSGVNRTVIAEPEATEIRSIIDAAPQLNIVDPDPQAQAILDSYAGQVTEFSKDVIGAAGEWLCARRMPNRPRSGSPECGQGVPADAVADSGAQLSINGGFIQQIVTDAFRARAFRADIALQNAGGVRIQLAPGNITIGDAYPVLPFSNTLVELDLTGQEVVDSLEEGLGNILDNNGSDGAYPYGSAIRWDVDLTQPRGQRFSNIEIKKDGVWLPIDLNATYVVVTNSFLAGGGDGYATFRKASDEGRVTDTFINYAQGLIDYLQQTLSGEPVKVPAPSEFSTQSVIAP